MKDQTKQPGYTPKRVEETARSKDILSRAKAALPVTGGADRLGTPSVGRDFL